MEMDELEQLRDLVDLQLLHIVAFRMSDYVPEAREVLYSVMKERGFSDQDLRDYRELYLRVQSLSSSCIECGVELRLESEDLKVGSFNCPECNAAQPVVYPDNAYRTPSELDTTELHEETEEEEAVMAKEAEVADAPVDLGPERDEDIPEGSSGVTCLKCEKELTGDEVFVTDGEFYCEKCFGELAESSEQGDTETESDDEQGRD